MKLYIITVCHMDSLIIERSLSRFMATINPYTTLVTAWIIVDHHWPLDKEYTSRTINSMAKYLNETGIPTTVISPEKNLGGHGGVNFALDHIRNTYTIADDDLILIYDPDSNPEQRGWLKALEDVMVADDKIAYLSLTHKVIVPNFTKNKATTVAGHEVYFDKLDMFNVTLFRASFLMKHKMQGNSSFYGHVETPMKTIATEEGMKTGYLKDWHELENPVPHPKQYFDWKIAHAAGEYKGNFDEYVK